MKYIPFTFLPILFCVQIKAQTQPNQTRSDYRYVNSWSSAPIPSLPASRRPAVSIDPASGVISIRVTDPQAKTDVKIYDLSGNLLYLRRLPVGNNIVTLTGMAHGTFVFCIEDTDVSLYSMKIVGGSPDETAAGE